MPRIAFVIAGALVLPLTLLLFVQWPLRDVVQAGSRQANDLAQVVFALYMAIAVTAASVQGSHLSAHVTGAGAPSKARWRRWAVVACTAPWALFLLWTSAGSVWQSLLQLERFGETLNPGYFLVRASLWLMALLVLLHGLASLRRA
jgi:TRAP-type C4-dicarboxylate transport system permease small subunit